MKKLLHLLTLSLLILQLSACTSNESREEIDDGVVSEDSLETENEGSFSEESVAENNDGFLDEQLPEDALGESTPAVDVADNTESVENEAASVVEDTAAVDDSNIDSTTSTETVTETTTETTTETVTESVPPEVASSEPSTSTSEISSESPDSFAAVDTGTTTTEVSSTSSALNDSFTSEEKPVSAPLRKVEAVPFKRAGVLLNAVYFGRPGDNWEKISQNIYGNTSKASELKKVNPFFSRVRPGDKIYYNSPNRPSDDTKLLTFFEESGMVPETYIAKEGDNLRSIAKDLLGYDGAWKEVWSSNSVDSKDTLAAGTELRFWRTVPVASPPPVVESAPEVVASLPPPPAMEAPAVPEPQMDLPPTDMSNDPSAMAGLQDLPPPPPAEALNPTPPPPPAPAPVIASPTPEVASEVGGLDNDMVMTLGGAGILVAGIALLMIVRKRRQQKEMSAAFGDTHVGT